MEGRDDDEEMFRSLSVGLADLIEAHLCSWTVGNVSRRVLDAGVALDDELECAARAAGERCRSEVGPVIRSLLTSDVDDQRTTPLVVLREAITYATEVLAAFGVPHVERDPFECRAFPADVYRLSPAALTDVDESLADAAMAWGAAKAYIHKRRHGNLYFDHDPGL